MNDSQVPLKVGYLWCLGNGLQDKIDWQSRDVKHKTPIRHLAAVIRGLRRAIGRLYLRQRAMHRDPDAWRIVARVIHAVFPMGRNEEMVARAQAHGRPVVVGKDRVALEKDDPLVPVLVVPLAGRRGLTGRDDSLDEDAPVGNEGSMVLFISRGGGQFVDIGRHITRIRRFG